MDPNRDNTYGIRRYNKNLKNNNMNMSSNAVCHRSYLSPGKMQVALFDDRLEVTSLGMLDSEITIEKMKTGLSKIRNRGIANAFS